MSVYKDEKRNTWYVKFRQRLWTGEYKWITKRGFRLKKDALQWECAYKMRKDGNLDMSFADFVTVYQEDLCPRLKESTKATKENIIDTKILPYFGKMRVRDISVTDILRWQNEMLSYRDPNTGTAYTKSYLKTVHNQLSAILNHAVRYYKLQENPATTAGNMGSSRGINMKYWTREEYLQFAEAMMDTPLAYYCFQVLYWCGIRKGELMALTPNDLDFQKKTLSITKTYNLVKGKVQITEPKTPKSNRIVTIPDFLAEELRDYLKSQPEMRSSDRMFPVSKTYLHNKMTKGCLEQGLNRIRIHDLRHSHVSLLIDMGYSAVAIANRLGHESIDITYRYAHLFPSVQNDMAAKLNSLMEDSNHVS